MFMVKQIGKGWKGLEVSAHKGETQGKVAKKEGGRNGNVGKNPTMAERWRSVVEADSGYQQLTHSTEQPALR